MPYGTMARVAARYAAGKAARFAAQQASRAFSAGPYSARWMGKGAVGGGRRKGKWGKSRFAQKVKKVILSTAEKCYRSYNYDGTTFNHDTLGTVGAWLPGVNTLWPPQGNGDGERRGDEIYTKGIMLRAVFQIPHDRRNTKFKLWFVQFDENQCGTLNKANFFHSVSNNVMVDPVQQDRWRNVKYLGTFACSAADQTTGSQDKTVIIKKWIPLKRRVTFQSDSSQQPIGVAERGYLAIAPYDSISSLTTDTLITNSEICYTLYYADP